VDKKIEFGNEGIATFGVEQKLKAKGLKLVASGHRYVNSWFYGMCSITLFPILKSDAE